MAEKKIKDDEQADAEVALASDLGSGYEALRDLTRGAFDAIIDLRGALPESPFSMSGVQLRLASHLHAARFHLERVALMLATEVYQP